jgi:hypothetical protein
MVPPNSRPVALFKHHFESLKHSSIWLMTRLIGFPRLIIYILAVQYEEIPCNMIQSIKRDNSKLPDSPKGVPVARKVVSGVSDPPHPGRPSAPRGEGLSRPWVLLRAVNPRLAGSQSRRVINKTEGLPTQVLEVGMRWRGNPKQSPRTALPSHRQAATVWRRKCTLRGQRIYLS